jgi:aspartate kinase
MIVMKFGGTSVGSAERIEAVAKIVKDRLDKKPVVVVSAVAGTTNSLIKLANEANKVAREQLYEALVAKHEAIVQGLGLPAELLDAEFEQLHELSSSGKKPSKKTIDSFVSFGERLCAILLASTLVKMDVNAKAYPAWDLGMITDDAHGAAEPLPTSPALISEKILALKAVPIITGYIGKTQKGEITTLGRGGSDYTAAIIGAALKAEAIQIWKEVDGILTTDPRLVPEARVVSELAFEEASELAYFGAKVLHPKTILPAMKAGVPVQVLNTFNPAGTGTTIVSSFTERKEKSHSVEAMTFKKGVTAIHVNSPEFFDGSGLMAQLFKIFEKHKTSIDVVSTSVAGVSVTIDNVEHLEALTDALAELGTVTIEANKAVVCIVGGSVNAAGIAGKLFTVLGENNIAVELISQASGGVSLTFVVAESDAESALKVLHKSFIAS